VVDNTQRCPEPVLQRGHEASGKRPTYKGNSWAQWQLRDAYGENLLNEVTDRESAVGSQGVSVPTLARG
jgi:hypothetical protein